LSKRGLGFINWQRKRKYIHRPEVLDAITRDLKMAPSTTSPSPAIWSICRCRTNTRARGAVARRRSAPPRDVTVVPGNHDVYVRGVEQAPAAFWGDYMRGDDGLDRFPFVRRRGDVALIALSTGVPTGAVHGDRPARQAAARRLAEALDANARIVPVVLIHHPPKSAAPLFAPPDRRRGLRGVLAARGAELLLHGHDHRRSLVWLDGPQGGKIPAVGVPSASADAPHGDEDGAGYNLFHIDGAAPHWRCDMIARQRTADGAIGDVEHALASRLAAARQHQGRGDQRHRAGHETERERGDCAPAPAAAVAAGLLRGNARQQRGILVERPLALDQAARDVSGHRLHDVGDFVRLGEHVAAAAAVVQETVTALVAPHGDMATESIHSRGVSPRLTPRSNRSTTGGISANSGSSASFNSSSRATSASRRSTTTLVRSAASIARLMHRRFQRRRRRSGRRLGFALSTPHDPIRPLTARYTNPIRRETKSVAAIRPRSCGRRRLRRYCR
jgi:hypothetical protein